MVAVVVVVVVPVVVDRPPVPAVAVAAPPAAAVVPAAGRALVVVPLVVDLAALTIEVALQDGAVTVREAVLAQAVPLAGELPLLLLEPVRLGAVEIAVVDTLLDPVLLVVPAVPEGVGACRAGVGHTGRQGDGTGKSELLHGDHPSDSCDLPRREWLRPRHHRCPLASAPGQAADTSYLVASW